MNEIIFYVDSEGKYLGAMGGELLEGSLNPYPYGIEVPSAPDSTAYVWDFSSKVWIEPVAPTNA